MDEQSCEILGACGLRKKFWSTSEGFTSRPVQSHHNFRVPSYIPLYTVATAGSSYARQGNRWSEVRIEGGCRWERKKAIKRWIRIGFVQIRVQTVVRVCRLGSKRVYSGKRDLWHLRSGPPKTAAWVCADNRCETYGL
jgi:hypothetical protein